MINFVIDIGTNSCRLMKADIQGNNITAIYKKLITARTGEGVNDTHRLSPAAVSRTSQAVYELYHMAKEDDPSAHIYCFATSATRDAENRQVLLDDIYAKTGISVDVISGETEAEISYAGAVGIAGGGLIDIGGGSTEIAFGEDGKRSYSHSFDIGAVRAKDMFGEDYDATLRHTRELLASLPHFYGEFHACGGTSTTVAAMLQSLKEYDPTKIQGYILAKESVLSLYNDIKELSADALRSMDGLQPQRADIIRHGIAILLAIFEAADIDHVIASEADNLEGYLMRIL